MTRDEVRLRILEIAVSHAPDADQTVLMADQYAGFVFDREPRLVVAPPRPMAMKTAPFVPAPADRDSDR